MGPSAPGGTFKTRLPADVKAGSYGGSGGDGCHHYILVCLLVAMTESLIKNKTVILMEYANLCG